MRQSMGTDTVREVTMLNDFLTGYLVPKDRQTRVFVIKFHIVKLTYS